MNNSAVISDCTLFRYRLDRFLKSEGKVYAFFGVNGSTATGEEDDHTVRKWNGFVNRFQGSRYIVGNAFGFRATDVKKLAEVDDAVGPLNDFYIKQIIEEADILVPCWGNSKKVPDRIRGRFSTMKQILKASGKPIKTFGFTNSDDPKHPLMLGYDTQLEDWIY